MGDALIRMHNGTLPSLVDGEYDFVDARDVVNGALAAETQGQIGKRYFLTGHVLSMRQIGQMLTAATGRPAPRLVAPMWLAQASAPFAELWAKMSGSRPLYTYASLKMLRSNCLFSRANSESDLGYTVRPPQQTIADAMAWFEQNAMLARPILPPQGQAAHD